MRLETDRIVHLAGLVTAALAALLALPRTMFAPGWFAVMALPAALLVLALHFQPTRWFGIRTRVLLAALLQVEMLKLGLSFLGPLQREAGLTLVLVPALTWMILRHRGSDGILGIFLSLCILLIAAMLPGGDVVVPGLVWFVASTLVLVTDTSLLLGQVRHAVVVAAQSRLLVWRARFGALLALAIAVPALLGLFGLLPGTLVRQPESRLAQGDTRAERPRVGLSDRFELGGQPGVPLEMLGEEILVVTPFGKVDEKVPENLYLRSTFFDVADVDRWTLGPFPKETIRCESDRATVGTLVRDVPKSTLAIQRLDASSGVVLTPPGLVEIGGVNLLEANRELGWYHERNANGELIYLVAFQDLGPLADTARPKRDSRRRLTTLPPTLVDARMRGLWTELGGDAPNLPAALLARRLIDALQSRCTYALEEPTGRSTSSLQRFLFEARKGYCMHFATALAVLLRMSNVPCRIGVGLQGGRVDPEDKGARRFGQKHAHAWVEIPFEGLGWVVFDPTPAAALPNPSPGPAGTVLPNPDPGAPSNFGAVLDALFVEPRARIALLTTLAIAVLTVIALSGRRLRSAVQAVVATRSALSRARHLLLALLREMKELGYARTPGQTLEAWLESLRGRAGVDHERLTRAIAAYQEVRFGGRDLDPQRVSALADAVPAPRA